MRPTHTMLISLCFLSTSLLAQELNQIFEGNDTLWVLPSDMSYQQFTYAASGMGSDLPDGAYRAYVMEETADESAAPKPIAYYHFTLKDNLLADTFYHLSTTGHVLVQGEYLMGRKNGYWYQFQDTLAIPVTKTFYESGRNMQMMYYTEAGDMNRRDIRFQEIDGTEKVLTTWFHPNGVLARQGITTVKLAGQQVALKEGQWRTWYPNGSLRAIERYEAGEYTEQSDYFHEDGRLSYRKVYRNGKFKEEIEYQYAEQTNAVTALYKNKDGEVRRTQKL